MPLIQWIMQNLNGDTHATLQVHSTMDATATVIKNAVSSISSTSTLTASGSFVLDAAALLTNSSILTADATITSGTATPPPTRKKPRVDYENTLGGGSFVAGTHPLPPAIAITFWHDKHIYSVTKRKKKNIDINLLDVEMLDTTVIIKLLNISKRKRKVRFSRKVKG